MIGHHVEVEVEIEAEAEVEAEVEVEIEAEVAAPDGLGRAASSGGNGVATEQSRSA